MLRLGKEEKREKKTHFQNHNNDSDDELCSISLLLYDIKEKLCSIH